jgi:NAD(P)-dependent dehydrogenase (short-subunit alcohol dehydrogenase family)
VVYKSRNPSDHLFHRVKVALATGGTSGIGTETVRALHATGADVYFTARDADKAPAILHDIRNRSDGRDVLVFIFVNMDCLGSVHNAAEAFPHIKK